METMSAYVPPHRKRYMNEQEWECQKCVVGDFWEIERRPARNLSHIMRCFNCGTRKPGYSVLGFGLQKKRSQDKIIVKSSGQVIKSKHCIPDGYATLDEWINHLKKNVVPMMKQKYNFWEVFTYIPIEVFEANIFPLVQMLKESPTARPNKCEAYTPLKDQKNMIKAEIIPLARCAQVCRSWNTCFKRNEFWKKLYLCRKVIDHYYNRIDTYTDVKFKRLTNLHHWTNDDIYSNRCSMKVINLSEIPFDIYWIYRRGEANPQGRKSIYKGTALAHKVTKGTKRYHGFNIQTYPGHNWFCLPKLSWLLDNPVSSIGFTWTVDILHLENMDAVDTEGNAIGTKPYHVVRITEKNPEDYRYIAGTQKKYKNYQHAVMKQVINKDILKRQREDNGHMQKDNLKDRKALAQRLNSKDEAIRHYECTNRDLDYILKIVQ